MSEGLFDLQLPDLPTELRRLLRQIPRGRVTTYGALASALGAPAAARWVGEYLANHAHQAHDAHHAHGSHQAHGSHDLSCPCHRVVRKSGELGLYVTGDPRPKREKLMAEGVAVCQDRVRLEQYAFDDFQTRDVLQPLLQLQTQIPQWTRLEPYTADPACVAGVDVSYIDRHSAVAAYALVDRATGQTRESLTERQPVTFPYIPGFLTFRESLTMISVLERAREAGQLADVVLVDGNGILHPRRAGLATCVGVATGCRTIGVGKSLLCGQVDLTQLDPGGASPIRVEGELVGYAVRARKRGRPIYVSPGHRIDVANAVRIVRAVFRGHRLPEPIYAADRLSRRQASALKAAQQM